eukprot:230743-Pyramimonas_sp.AAC.1
MAAEPKARAVEGCEHLTPHPPLAGRGGHRPVRLGVVEGAAERTEQRRPHLPRGRRRQPMVRLRGAQALRPQRRQLALQMAHLGRRRLPAPPRVRAQLAEHLNAACPRSPVVSSHASPTNANDANPKALLKGRAWFGLFGLLVD